MLTTDFSKKFPKEGLTFDDVLLIPAKSDVLPKEIEVKTRLAGDIMLNTPIVTAAMDTVTETEMAIQHAITQVLTGRTAFIVAHRLSTIRSADRILVIGEGRILEEGTHQQLLAQKGHYYELYTNQFQQEQQQQVLSGPLSFEA